MNEVEKREIMDKVAALRPEEQATVIGVIRGMELANTINSTESKKKADEKASA